VLPNAPEVNDANLTPVPQPAHVLHSWKQAATLSRDRSTDLRIALAEIEKAHGSARQVLAGSLPSVQGTASFTVTPWSDSTGSSSGTDSAGAATGAAGGSAPADYWQWRTGISISQPILALRDWHAIGTASRAEHNAQLSAEDQQRQVLTEVAKAILAVIVAEHMADLNRAGLRSALETLELTRTRARLDAANALDIVRVRQDVAVARSAVVTGDETLRQAREALGTTLGYGEPWGVSPDFDLALLEGQLRAACQPIEKVEDRADLAAAAGAVDIADRGVDDVWMQFMPTADLSTALTGSGSQASGGAAGALAIMASLSAPIWDGGARYGALRQARAGLDEAQQKLEAARRGATIEVSRAGRSVGVAEDARAVSSDARDLAVETERLVRLNYAAGGGTSLDLVTAAQQRRQADIQLAVKDYAVISARIDALLTKAHCPLAGATTGERSP